MRKLYEINADIEQCIMEGTDFETGEFNAFDKLNELQMERDAKLEGVALYVKDCRAEAAAIEAEIKTLKERMDKLNRNADGAESWLANSLDGQKFSTSKVECSFRKSVAVEVDEKFVAWAEVFSDDHELLTVKKSVVPNKKYIKELLKNGSEFRYARLVEKNNLTVR